MKHLTTFALALALSAPAVIAQTPAKEEANRAKAAAADKDTTYGRVKEFTAKEKIVIDVDNAVDKTFDLKDKDVKVTLAKGLKVGDPVKVVERETAGKAHTVMITKHAGGGVAHGDKDPNAKKP